LASDATAAFMSQYAQPTALFDIDGVLCFWEEWACVALNSRFETQMLCTDPTQPWRPSSLPLAQATWLNAAFDDVAVRNQAPDFKAIDAVTALHAAGVRVVIGSDRPTQLAQATATWLGTWNVPYDDLVLVGSGGKLAYAQKHQVAWIDDNPRYATSLPAGDHLYMPDRPWTASWLRTLPDVTVFTDWSELLQQFAL